MSAVDAWPEAAMVAPRLQGSVAKVQICIPDDDLGRLPGGRFPEWPADALPPQRGDIVYLTSTSAWIVTTVVHELLPGPDVRVEVWLQHVGGARLVREPQCTYMH